MKFACDTNVLVDVLRTPAAEGAFAAFLARFSHVTFLSAVGHGLQEGGRAAGPTRRA